MLAAWLRPGLAVLLWGLGAVPCAAVRTPPFLQAAKADAYGLRCMQFSKLNMDHYVTAIVTTSPRPEDATGEGLGVLKDTIRSIRDVLGFKRSRIILACDEAKKVGPGAVSKAAEESYEKKLRDLKLWSDWKLGGQVTLFRNNEWTHQTELLHRVFDHLKDTHTLTPIVYMAQDDSPVSGSIDVPLILQKLACDPKVDYVKFLWVIDCFFSNQAMYNVPCDQHPETPLLHSVDYMSDRPHFATSSFYYNSILEQCPRDWRGAPERCVKKISKAWTYGKRHSMLHDTNELKNAYNKYTNATQIR